MTQPNIFLCDKCKKYVCDVCFCEGFASTAEAVAAEPQVDALDRVYHTLWDELHSEVSTGEQFVAWCAKVPGFGCQCKDFLKKYVAENPYPDGAQLDVQRMYGWELHNAVNEKLRAEGKDRPHFSWEQFLEKYPRF